MHWLTRFLQALTIIITTLLRLLFPSRSRFKNETWKRTIGMAVLRYTFHRIPINQLQFLVGDSLQTYGSWTKYNDVPSTIDCLDMDTKLLWIGQKRTDRVILYLHGTQPATGTRRKFVLMLRLRWCFLIWRP